jgi:hypothetical protein
MPCEYTHDPPNTVPLIGPITLFDKSFLQAISVDEAVWFDRFFTPVVCPVFYVETMADLAKEPAKRRPAEVIVREIAAKFPEMSGSPCGFHVQIAINDLLGYHTPMDGRIPRPGGRPVKTGTVFERTPEEKAFERWSRGQFHDVERIAAPVWRKALAELDLAKVASEFRSLGIDGKMCKSLEQARDLARGIVDGRDNIPALLALASLFLQIPQQYHAKIFQAWEREGRRAFSHFAPYAAHVVSIEIFFQTALAAGLIAAERPSNRTDIAYLFYLPFCSLFVSSDNLDRRTASLFMRPDQEFVWGIDLKPSLKQINAHFLKLPEDVREEGLMRFADSPPPENLVADLWDRHLRPGYRDEPKTEMPPEKATELLKRIKAFRKQKTVDPNDPDRGEEEMISVQRTIRRKRGSWWQVLAAVRIRGFPAER